ncbi:delta(12) fatty acid desaturase FAD2-like [Gigantopelta aegis]|uniref:delta(12) fatty acid desaturase FAD2-like n=1 Tax=Gigantopelta aegis TaxID=1735272 RepID=UPI001B889074|nr:delta(12) fatty acid desaturase FAD2-like [Gigantopelta aegis]
MARWKSGVSGWVQMLLNTFLFTLVTEDATQESVTSEDTTAATLVEDTNVDSLSKVKLPRKLPSIIEIKKRLPSHCFDRQTSTSMYYMIRDFVQVIAAYYVGEFLWNNLSPAVLVVVAPVFVFVQGTFFTSLFVIGHDCGHRSFSNYRLLDDMVGNVTHTFLMTPFYTWKLTHSHHHKNTGNIDRDEVFYPVRRKYDTGGKVLPGFGLGIGWFGYLITGYKPRNVPHFDPFQPMYRKHVVACLVSLVSMAIWGTCLYRYAVTVGCAKFCYHYFGPLFVFATYTVVITFLHHHDDDIPWYSDHLWDNVRGQLSSIDRDYGIVHYVIHSIGTHQVHHLFPKMPHYHLEEATQVFRKEFPELVHLNKSPIFPAYFNMFARWAKQCIIADDTDVHIYK